MKNFKKLSLNLMAAVILTAATGYLRRVEAASCCGGGSSASLVLPKFAKLLLDTSFSHEYYNGFWSDQGKYLKDPQNSDLRQLRINAGTAYRVHKNIQLFLSLPYVVNLNQYSGNKSTTYGLGDVTAGTNIELFNDIRCVYKVRSLEDLWPATYLGLKAILPTGLSPYDDAPNSFDITGLGFYTFDFSLLMDKSINAFNMSIGADYALSAERPVNREYGKFVQPYMVRQGDKLVLTASFGYSFMFDSMDSLTVTGGYSYVEQFFWKINGNDIPFSGFSKHNLTLTLAFSTADQNNVIKLINTFNLPYDKWGYNKPSTISTTLEYSHVFR